MKKKYAGRREGCEWGGGPRRGLAGRSLPTRSLPRQLTSPGSSCSRRFWFLNTFLALNAMFVATHHRNGKCCRYFKRGGFHKGNLVLPESFERLVE